jgi:hypothetical protein
MSDQLGLTGPITPLLLEPLARTLAALRRDRRVGGDRRQAGVAEPVHYRIAAVASEILRADCTPGEDLYSARDSRRSTRRWASGRAVTKSTAGTQRPAGVRQVSTMTI